MGRLQSHSKHRGDYPNLLLISSYIRHAILLLSVIDTLTYLVNAFRLL